MPPSRPVRTGHVCYRQELFDESSLAYMLDLHDEIEKVRVKRDLYVERGDNAKVLHYEALRNEHITALQVLLKAMRK
jgi:hypothetical protein